MKYLREIVITTVRNYQGRYYDNYIFIDPDKFTDEIMEKFHWKFLYVKSTEYAKQPAYHLINCVEQAFEEKHRELGLISD